MLEELKQLELTLKRHINDAKREIIREITNGDSIKAIKDNIKEKVNGQKIK